MKRILPYALTLGLVGCVSQTPPDYREDVALTMMTPEHRSLFTYYDPHIEVNDGPISYIGPVSSYDLPDHRTRIIYTGRKNNEDEFIIDYNVYKEGNEEAFFLLPGQGRFVGLDYHVSLRQSVEEEISNPETGEKVNINKVILLISQRE